MLVVFTFLMVSVNSQKVEFDPSLDDAKHIGVVSLNFKYQYNWLLVVNYHIRSKKHWW